MLDLFSFQFGDTHLGPREIQIGITVLILLLVLVFGRLYWKWKLGKWRLLQRAGADLLQRSPVL